MPRPRFGRRLLLVLAGAFSLLCALLVGSALTLVAPANRHIGADYLGFVSEVVRGQGDNAGLRQAIDSLVENPEPLHHEQVREQTMRIANRQGSVRQYLQRSDLAPADYRHVLDEYRTLQRDLMQLESLLANAGLNAASIEQIDALGTRLDDSLAFIYSELHHLVLGAAAEQHHYMERLTRWIVALGLLVLAVIAALMAALYQIARQKQLVEALSVTDELTGLNNRRALLDQASRLFAQSTRSGAPVSLALIDIDHFKQVNDEHGHPTGDRVLVALATLLKDVVRRADVVARIGGEEFCVLMPATDAAGAAELCERLRRGVAQHAFRGAPGQAEALSITISAGVTTSRTDTAPPDDSFAALYPRADQALYQAKQNGRNRVEVG